MLLCFACFLSFSHIGPLCQFLEHLTLFHDLVTLHMLFPPPGILSAHNNCLSKNLFFLEASAEMSLPCRELLWFFDLIISSIHYSLSSHSAVFLHSMYPSLVYLYLISVLHIRHRGRNVGYYVYHWNTRAFCQHVIV